MHYTTLLFAIVASVASAAVQFTNPSFAGITAGTPFEITWTGATDTVTINLKSGPSTSLITALTIVAGIPGDTGTFTWTPAQGLTDNPYALEISSGQEINYSPQFEIIGGTASTTTTTSSPISTSSSSSTSTTSQSSKSSTGSTTTSATLTTSKPHGNSTVTTTSKAKSSGSDSSASDDDKITSTTVVDGSTTAPRTATGPSATATGPTLSGNAAGLVTRDGFSFGIFTALAVVSAVFFGIM